MGGGNLINGNWNTSGWTPNLPNYSQSNQPVTTDNSGNVTLNPYTGSYRNYGSSLDVQSGDSDAVKAAKLTAQGNLAATQTSTAANRVNQYNPYGNIQYQITGTDASGNPIWSSATNLSPEQQQLLDLQNQQSISLGNLGNTVLGQVQNAYGQPFDVSQYQQQMIGGGPELQTSLGDQGMQAWDKASNLVMQRLQPQMDRQSKQLDAQLANQGIMQGSEAYNNAKQQLAQQQNDLMNQAQLTGLNAQNQFFGQGLQAGQFGNTAEQQQYSNQLAQQAANNAALQANLGQGLTAYNLPMNTLQQLRAGSQVTNPTFSGVNQQATTSGADVLGAYTNQQAQQQAAANAAAARQSSFTSGLMGLGGMLGGAAIMSGW